MVVWFGVWFVLLFVSPFLQVQGIPISHFSRVLDDRQCFTARSARHKKKTLSRALPTGGPSPRHGLTSIVGGWITSPSTVVAVNTNQGMRVVLSMSSIGAMFDYTGGFLSSNVSD